MQSSIKVLIGIQARSSSTRLPNKCNLIINKKTILQQVINVCRGASVFLHRTVKEIVIQPSVVLLIPKGDPIAKKYKCNMFEGDEHDVLSRYVDSAKEEDADLIVRITSDCYRLPSFMICRAVKAAIKRGTDYTSNTLVRTYQEGWDVEVMTRKCLNWLDENATNPADREHVCTAISPATFPHSICSVVGHYDLSHIKSSIDTQEEYDATLLSEDKLKVKMDYAYSIGEVEG